MLKTVIVLISHQTPPEVAEMCATWQRGNPDALVHVAYGGKEASFDELAWPNRSFIRDPRLRTRDHQRDRQSYLGIMRETVMALEKAAVDRVLMVECDVVPLRDGLTDYLLRREEEEDAQMLGTRLRRVDGTNHPHYLAHQSHPRFEEWLAQSVREDKTVVLMMMGSLSWWTWQAFAAVAGCEEPMPVYLEIALPTVAHQLGFRVRGLKELDDCLEPLGEMEGLLEQWRHERKWVAHPCKRIWLKSRSE